MMPSLFGLTATELVLLGSIFISVTLVALSLAMFVGDRTQRRTVIRSGSSLRYGAPEGKFTAWLSRFGSEAAETYDQEDRSRLRLQLIRAGLRNPAAVYIYYATRLVLALALPFVAAAAAYFAVGNIGTQKLMLLVFGTAALGLYIPAFWLSRRVASRQSDIQTSFPDALDMLLVCVEAGAGFPQALQRVSIELQDAHPVLAEELQLICAGLNAGQTREQALRQFADRTGTDDVSAFATIMIQSEAFGTSIAETLRVQAAEMRVARMMRAEEMANKLPVKITIPLALLIFPVLFLVIMTPVALRILAAIHNTP